MTPETPQTLRLPFTHAGVDRHLVKHKRIARQLAAGTITLERARLKPWYLRWKPPGELKERYFALSHKDGQAIADALDLLRGNQKQPSDFAAFLAFRDAKRGVTVGTLAAAWLAENCPFAKTKLRTTDEAAPLKTNLLATLEWWRPRVWSAITKDTIEDFVVWTCQQVTGRYKHCTGPAKDYTGHRTADLQLAALSCLGQWTVLTARAEKNPFEKRTRYRDAKAVRHCHEAMPDNDEHLHRILTWLFTHRNPDAQFAKLRGADVDRHERIAGAWLAFTALSGLRPGEPKFLQHVPAAAEFPANLTTAAPGLIYPMPDGTRRMKVVRAKNGQNPAILIHPALADFLNHWTAWLDQDLGGTRSTASPIEPRELFPFRPQLLARHLNRACAALGLTRLKPHGFGRGYYVRVRRSQGADDATIAVELGQTSDGDLIRTTYGDPKDPVGGNLHDWLPKDIPAAWTHLRESESTNTVAIQFRK